MKRIKKNEQCTLEVFTEKNQFIDKEHVYWGRTFIVSAPFSIMGDLIMGEVD